MKKFLKIHNIIIEIQVFLNKNSKTIFPGKNAKKYTDPEREFFS